MKKDRWEEADAIRNDPHLSTAEKEKRLKGLQSGIPASWATSVEMGRFGDQIHEELGPLMALALAREIVMSIVDGGDPDLFKLGRRVEEFDKKIRKLDFRMTNQEALLYCVFLITNTLSAMEDAMKITIEDARKPQQ